MSRGCESRRTTRKRQDRDELYNRAKALKIEGRRRMSKSELIAAIRRRG
jgi:hypothetical protein